MDTWKPNPYAAPYVPRGRSVGTHLHFTPGSCRIKLTRLLQTALLLVLLVTLLINVLFVVDTTKKLQQADPQHGADDDDTDLLGDELGMEGNRAPRNIKQVEEPARALQVEVLSSHTKVSVTVDGTTILEDGEEGKNRGIHILVLNQATGAVMAQRVFDTYSAHEDEAMVLFLNMVSDGRILVFAVKDEGSFQMKAPARSLLAALGSSHAAGLGWRDMWAMVTVKAGNVVGEQYSKSPDLASWGAPSLLKAELPLRPLSETECDWPPTPENKRRRVFCNKLEGYGSVCSCKEPAPLTFQPETIDDTTMDNVPIVVIASDRPHYLYRMLRSLLSANGVNPSMITVFIDGYFEAPLEVTKLFGLKGIQHTPIGVKNARISQHYKASLTATFSLFPEASYALILEEDLDVSPDIISYFSQTLPLMEEDPTIYCVSAWNDQGYDHSCHDPALLYRVETMPGLGWLLKKSLYKDELEPNWPTPEKLWDWDMWMRLPTVRKQRECIVPDISRTYHFGSKGLNMNTYFQEMYFKKHTLNTSPHVRLKDVFMMKQAAYEELVRGLIKKATVLDHTKSPCEEGFIPDEHKADVESYVMYIRMDHMTEYSTWKQVAKCFHLWDLDVRGVHQALWRFYLKNKPVFVIGVPASPYSEFMPPSLTPIYLQENNT